MNAVLVETYIAFKISSSPFIINSLKEKKLVPIAPLDEDTNTQSYLASDQTPKGGKRSKLKL